MFSEVPANVKFPQLEEDILRVWREQGTFQKSLDIREGAPEFVFYEGPPTANGKPGVHHVQARAYKDLFPRYKTMQGFLVRRKAGWDCHGLPVELEVEKRNGFSGKKAIEAFGVEPFNKACRTSVMEYEEAWRQMTERIGFWVDLDNAYMTMTNEYVESIWWSLKRLWDKGLIYLGYKVVPFCPRCGTPLSSHEVGLGYKDIVDPSITVRFPLHDPAVLGLPANTSLLVWTTTPWTLPGNVAAAIHPDLPYVAARRKDDEETFVLARALLDRVLGQNNWIIEKELTAENLRDARYTPPFPGVAQSVEARSASGEVPTEPFRVVTGEFVTAEDGTGIVHMAPAFGADDMEMSRRYGLPVLRTVTEEGRFIPEVTLVAGEFFKKGDPIIMRDLKQRGVLFSREDYKHSYPHCWRCDTTLMYYATNSWFIRNTSLKEQLIAKNQEINWVPAHIKNGRYGDWLNNLVDWALSRSRYWGTPLPIWICEGCGGQEMVGSFEALAARADEKFDARAADFDPHRPFVDGVTFTCLTCQGKMRRIPDVIDCWYDSGAMPFAQFHYPFENRERFDNAFPADFICEGLDQTRGWFNSLHQLGVMLFDNIAYKTVICHGLVLDENGDKMSKRLGNIVNPWDVLNVHGADALRWYLYASAPPEMSRRFSVNLVGDAVRGYMLTLWNTYSFFTQYANLDKPDLKNVIPYEERPPIDRWAVARLHETTAQVIEAMDAYDPTKAARALESLVDDLSNWYVRRNRRRFWKSGADQLSAYQTLYESLVGIAKLSAPFTPFLSEAMYQNLVRGMDPLAPQSVHLCDYPQPVEGKVDRPLLDITRALIDTVSLGRAARAGSKLRTRQPLSEAVVRPRSAEEIEGLKAFTDQLLEELNVKKVRFLDVSADFVDYRLRPNLPVMGRKFGKQVPAIKAALESADGKAAAAAARDNRPFEVTLSDGSVVALTAEELLIEAKATEGYAFADEGGRLVALNTHLTEELIREGLARDLVRYIQDARKAAGFEVTDQIECWLPEDDPARAAGEAFKDTIEGETQAVLHFAPPPTDAFVHEIKKADETLVTTVSVRKAVASVSRWA
ncbi:MAG: isoleucine--tRNA ligase [Armatimonadetes bacterium]|nr:isoleucine--tRNA ligase [Armatimonadota bacterium]